MFINLPPIDILVLAAAAVMVLYRLYKSLGQRQQGDENRPDQASSNSSKSNIEVLKSASKPQANAKTEPLKNDGFDDLRQIDTQFDPKSFIKGASMAYELITDAITNSDTQKMRPLLNNALFDSICAEIKQRAQDQHIIEQEFVGFNDVKISEHVLEGSIATITVCFESEQHYAVYDKERNLVAGDNEEIIVLRDIWQFQRDLRSNNPNWKLIAIAEDADAEEED